MFLVNISQRSRDVLENVDVIRVLECTVRIAAALARQAHCRMNSKNLDKLLVVIVFSILNVVNAAVRIDMPVSRR